MKRKVKLELTFSEARNLSYAAGNSIDYPDVMDSLFPEGSPRNAAYRGFEKLNDAIRKAGARRKTNG